MSELERKQPENLHFETKEQLEDFVEKEFIPGHIYFVKKRKEFDQDREFVGYIETKNGKMKKYSSTRIPAIKLKDIISLNLNETETNNIMKYLEEKNILVRGKDTILDEQFENYENLRTYKNQELPKALTSEESQIKAELYQKKKDNTLRDELILGNMRLVPYVCWRYSLFYDKDISEIESYGYEALVEAINNIDNYDKSRGTFTNYLVNQINYWIQKNKTKLYNPQNKTSNRNWYSLYLKAKNNVEKRENETILENEKLARLILDEMIRIEQARKQTHPQYIKMINLSTAQPIPEDFKKYKEAYNQIRKILMESMVSLDEYLEDEIWNAKEEIRNVDNIIQSKNPENIVIKKELTENLNNLLDSLTDRERTVLDLLLGLSNGHPLSENQVGKILNMTENRVRQIELKAIRKLRLPVRSKPLKDYREKSETSIITNLISPSSNAINYSELYNLQDDSEVSKRRR
mgnify:FL=1